MTNPGASRPEEWTLREIIFTAAHRWPIFLLFCLCGALAGWLLALILPSTYRATRELYVGINPYQSGQDTNAAQISGIQFNHADDYKNWQMASLNTLVHVDPIIQLTLQDLRQVDPHWDSITNQELSGMLHIYWRNAGKWRLVAEHFQAERAQQAVTAWEEVVVQYANQAIEQSRQVMAINIKMQALAAEIAKTQASLAEIEQLRQELHKSQQQLGRSPADQPLSPETRENLWNIISLNAIGSEWHLILDPFPGQAAPHQVYQTWLKQADQVAESLNNSFKGQLLALDQQYTQLVDQYSQASKQSLGLSPDLHLDQIAEEGIQVTQVRPLGLLILIGALLGAIFWLFIVITRINQKSKQ